MDALDLTDLPCAACRNGLPVVARPGSVAPRLSPGTPWRRERPADAMGDLQGRLRCGKDIENSGLVDLMLHGLVQPRGKPGGSGRRFAQSMSGLGASARLLVTPACSPIGATRFAGAASAAGLQLRWCRSVSASRLPASALVRYPGSRALRSTWLSAREACQKVTTDVPAGGDIRPPSAEWYAAGAPALGPGMAAKRAGPYQVVEPRSQSVVPSGCAGACVVFSLQRCAGVLVVSRVFGDGGSARRCASTEWRLQRGHGRALKSRMKRGCGILMGSAWPSGWRDMALAGRRQVR